MGDRGRLQLNALTGVRFLAALHVLCLHFAPDSLKAIYPLGNILQTGYVAVSFFFVLSGFVLAYNYIGSDQSMTVGRKEFWNARFARIYPAYFLGLVLTAPMFIADMLEGAETGSRALGRIVVFGSPALLLVQSWFPNTSLLWNYPGWSLSVEACFYFVFPFAVLALRSAKRPRQLVMVMLACWTAGQVFPVLYLATNPEGAREPWAAWQGLFTMHFDGHFSRILRFNPALHIPEFVMGLCLGKLFLVRERFNGSLQRSGSVLSLVGFVAILAALTAADKLPFPMLHNGLLAPFFCMVIYGLALGGGVLPRVLGSAPFRLAGEASYGMYILQVPVWLAFSALLGNQAAHGMGGFLLYLVCHFIVCVLVLWYVEEPARRWLKRLLPRERQTRAVRVHSAV